MIWACLVSLPGKFTLSQLQYTTANEGMSNVGCAYDCCKAPRRGQAIAPTMEELRQMIQRSRVGATACPMRDDSCFQRNRRQLRVIVLCSNDYASRGAYSHYYQLRSTNYCRSHRHSRRIR